jgi:hypothetical protein
MIAVFSNAERMVNVLLLAVYAKNVSRARNQVLERKRKRGKKHRNLT